jgi:hypothetical protein
VCAISGLPAPILRLQDIIAQFVPFPLPCTDRGGGDVCVCVVRKSFEFFVLHHNVIKKIDPFPSVIHNFVSVQSNIDVYDAMLYYYILNLTLAALLFANAEPSRRQDRDHCVESGCYPLYYILGSPKSGTTSLWDMFSGIHHSNASSMMNPCVADRKELRYWSQTVDNYQLKLRKYLSFFPRDSSNCPSSAYMEATPTYLGFVIIAVSITRSKMTFTGDVIVPHRMKKDIPRSVHNRMRFLATLRDPLSRDLSWFNVLYSKCAKKSEVVFSARSESDSFLRLHNIDETRYSVSSYGSNKAGISVSSIKQLCSVSSNRKSYLLDASTCYDRYTELNLKLYQGCEKSTEFVRNDTSIVHSVLKILLSTAGLDSQSSGNIESELIKSEAVRLCEVYAKCYKSGILRTGGIMLFKATCSRL